MIQKNSSLPPPSTYQAWLDCFEFLRSNKIDQEVFNQVISGTFDYEDNIKLRFQRHLVETVNFMLNKYTKRFSRNLNELVEFNEIAELPQLFQELKRDVHYCLFFKDLDFLSEDFKNELRQSVETNMNVYWQDVIKFLHEEANDVSNGDLEDAFFLINRINLFQKQ